MMQNLGIRCMSVLCNFKNFVHIFKMMNYGMQNNFIRLAHFGGKMHSVHCQVCFSRLNSLQISFYIGIRFNSHVKRIKHLFMLIYQKGYKFFNNNML